MIPPNEQSLLLHSEIENLKDVVQRQNQDISDLKREAKDLTQINTVKRLLLRLSRVSFIFREHNHSLAPWSPRTCWLEAAGVKHGATPRICRLACINISVCAHTSAALVSGTSTLLRLHPHLHPYPCLHISCTRAHSGIKARLDKNENDHKQPLQLPHDQA